MKEKLLKLFLVYSLFNYISLACYVGSENSLNVAKAIIGKGGANVKDLKFESLWKTTFKRWKEMVKLIIETGS